ncbi:hypothetical protein D3C76_1489350 [compost metagenome]
MLVLGRVHIGAQLVGGSPEGFLQIFQAGGWLCLGSPTLSRCWLRCLQCITGRNFSIVPGLETLTRLAQRLLRQACRLRFGTQHRTTTPAPLHQQPFID